MTIKIEKVSADSAVARLQVRVMWELPAQDLVVKGSIVGPRCPGVTTVEVAYPLVVVESHSDAVVLAGVIPEPNYWMPERPMTYQVLVEASCQGQVMESQAITLRFRGSGTP